MVKYKVLSDKKLSKTVSIRKGQIRYDLEGLIEETQIIKLKQDGIIEEVIESESKPKAVEPINQSNNKVGKKSQPKKDDIIKQGEE